MERQGLFIIGLLAGKPDKYLFTSLIVVFALAAGAALLSGPAFAKSNLPADIGGHWAEAEIRSWMEKGLVKGYEDSTFQPENEISRAEFIALLNRALGLNFSGKKEFPDVAPDSWYAPEVARAAAAGYLLGYEDGGVQPEREISRQEAAVFLVRALRLAEEEGSSLEAFADAAAVAAWSKEAVETLAARGYMEGYPDGSFLPAKAVSRAETITILSRALGAVYNISGTYGFSSIFPRQTLKGSAVISAARVTLQNKVIEGNLYLTADSEGSMVELRNVAVQGTVFISGAGEGSIMLNNCALKEVIIDRRDGKIQVKAQGDTVVETVEAVSSARLVRERQGSGRGFAAVIMAAGSEVELAGSFKKVRMAGEAAALLLSSGSIDFIEVTRTASEAEITVGEDAGAVLVELKAPANVINPGTVIEARINTSGSNLKYFPKAVELAEGVTVTIGGTRITEALLLEEQGEEESSRSSGRRSSSSPPPEPVLQITARTVDDVVSMAPGGEHVSEINNTWLIEVDSGTLKGNTGETLEVCQEGEENGGCALLVSGLPSGLTAAAARGADNTIIVTVSGEAKPCLKEALEVNLVIQGKAVSEADALASAPFSTVIVPAAVDLEAAKYKKEVIIPNTVMPAAEITCFIKQLKKEQTVNPAVDTVIKAVYAEDGTPAADYLSLADGAVFLARQNETGTAVTEKVVLSFSLEDTAAFLVVTVTVEALEQAAAPTADPPAGSYEEVQGVALSTSTGEAVIWYTSDGSDPADPENPSRTKYTGVITIAEGIIRAYAVREGLLDSEELTAVYRQKSWDFAGEKEFSEGQAWHPDLYVQESTPYVAYQDYAHGRGISVKRCSKASWEYVGAPGFTAGLAAEPSLFMDEQGIPHAAFIDSAAGDHISVMKYTGKGEKGWDYVGEPGFSEGPAGYPSLFIYESTPYAAFACQDHGGKAVVMKYTGEGDSGWEPVGAAGFSSKASHRLSLFIADDGIPHVGFKEGIISSAARSTVMKFLGITEARPSGWEPVGSAEFSSGYVRFPTLFVYEGTPYMAYAADDHGDKAVVRKYTGQGETGWEALGPPEGFSPDSAINTSLFIHEGIPYAAFRDGAESSRATVMKYTGSKWTLVGDPGFSHREILHLSLFVDEEGVPYLAYQDSHILSRSITVIKFE